MRISKDTLNILRQYDAGAEKAWRNWLSLERFECFECHTDTMPGTGFGVWVAGYWHSFRDQFVAGLEAESNV